MNGSRPKTRIHFSRWRFAGMSAARQVAKLPPSLTGVPVSLLQLALLASYGLPGNPLRQTSGTLPSCQREFRG